MSVWELLSEMVEPGVHITTALGAELSPDAAEVIGHSVKNPPVWDIR